MLIDLSHPLPNGTKSFPGDPVYETSPHVTHEKDRFSVTNISMGSHQGTHLDAPYHFYADGKTIDQMPLEPFYGQAKLVDLAPGGELEANSELTVETFAAHADAFQLGARLILRTGWEKNFGAETFFTEFPSITPEAAEWIASTGIALLGMDLPTPGTPEIPTRIDLPARGASFSSSFIAACRSLGWVDSISVIA